jgi:hypothetical protein
VAASACRALPIPAAGPAPSAPSAPGRLAAFRDPGHVTYSRRISACHTRDHGQLPDPACTPGSIDPAVTQADIGSTICREGWTATIRPPESQTEHAKFDVVDPAYGMSPGATGELDHEVPLELGGSNDVTNLWLEAGPIPNPKDAVEGALKRAVCDRKVSLLAAQAAIARDWMTAGRVLGVPAAGHQ